MSQFNLQEAFSKYEEYKHPRGQGGKWTKKYSSEITTSKVIGKNILHDALAGAAYGGAEGLSRHSGLKLGGKMALAMGGIGAGWGLGEGLIKHKLLKNADTKEKLEKKVSHPAYKYGNVASLAAYATVGDILNNKYQKISDKVGRINVLKERRRIRKGLPAPEVGKIADALNSVKTRVKGSKVGAVTGKLIKKHPVLKRALPIAAAIGAGYLGRAFSDSASEAVTSKVYGPERPDTVGTESLYTKKALKTGLFSGKKYKYGGLGPEIKKRKAKNK